MAGSKWDIVMNADMYRKKYAFVFDIIEQKFGSGVTTEGYTSDYGNSYSVVIRGNMSLEGRWRGAITCEREELENLCDGTAYIINEDGFTDLLPPDGGWKYKKYEITEDHVRKLISCLYDDYLAGIIR